MKVPGRESTAERRDIELLHHAYGSAGLRFLERIGTPDDERWSRARDKGKDSAKDHLAHLAVVEETGLELLMLAIGRAQPEAPTEAANVAELVSQPVVRILDTLHETVAEQLSTLLALEDDGLLELPVAVPGWQRPGTLAQLFDQMFVEAVVHYQWIRAALVRPQLPHWWEGWMPEDSHDFYDRFFALLPVLYTPRPDTAGTLAIELRPPGGGCWELTLDADQARLASDGPGEPAGVLSGRASDFLDFWIGRSNRIKDRGRLAKSFGALFPAPVAGT